MRLPFILIVFTATLVSGCNNLPDNKVKEDVKIKKEIFITGNDGLSREVLESIVEESEILKGGYILIIPVGIPTQEKRLGNLKGRIEKVCPNAVHILELNYNSPEILPSQKVTVEGAGLIFLIGNRLGRFMNAPWSQVLTEVIFDAYHAGSTIVGINKAGALIGEKFIPEELDNPDAVIKELPSNITLQNGLNLVNGFIFDCIYANSIAAEEEQILEFLDKLNKYYVGVPAIGAVFIDENKFIDLGENKTVVKLSGSDPKWTDIKGLNWEMNTQH